MTWRSAGLLLVLAGGCGGPEPECAELDERFVWVDGDGDGFGSAQEIGYVCTVAPGQAPNDSDCDDGDATVYPTAAEICDLLDNDCNDRIDEAQPSVPWHPDLDGDGFGDDREVETACVAPGPEWIAAAGDCDDADLAVNPSAREVCNGFDDDCDGQSDDQDEAVDPTTRTRYYADLDGDGYGDDLSFVDRCEAPPDTADVADDCNDGDASIHPEAADVCGDFVDNDCNGSDCPA